LLNKFPRVKLASGLSGSSGKGFVELDRYHIAIASLSRTVRSYGECANWAYLITIKDMVHSAIWLMRSLPVTLNFSMAGDAHQEFQELRSLFCSG
jgi:hypothetical protein